MKRNLRKYGISAICATVAFVLGIAIGWFVLPNDSPTILPTAATKLNLVSSNDVIVEFTADKAPLTIDKIGQTVQVNVTATNNDAETGPLHFVLRRSYATGHQPTLPTLEYYDKSGFSSTAHAQQILGLVPGLYEVMNHSSSCLGSVEVIVRGASHPPLPSEYKIDDCFYMRQHFDHSS